MVHQLPTGAKDLLPLDVAQKRWIESRIQQVFQSWGYQRIITPTVEHLRSLTAGGAVDPESVIQLHSSSIDILGLRPEFTASIARAYAARLGGNVATCPQRIYYNANVFRRKSNNSSEESFQAGVELLGASGLLADGEILLLLAESFERVELDDWKIILGDARLTGVLLDLLPEQYRAKVRQALAKLDRIALVEMDLPADVKGYALELIDLRGKPKDVLSRLANSAWTSGLTGEINYLKSLIDLWESTGKNTGWGDRLILDLSFMQTFDYYTGIVFEVACNNYVVAQGGRYDRLLGVYHPQNVSYPSIGFCINLEDLQQALQSRLPQTLTTSSCLVVAKNPDAMQAAFAHATKLRQANDAVELELEFRPEDVVRDHARSRGIPQIAWISADGTSSSESI